MNTALMIRTMRFIADHEERWDQNHYGRQIQAAQGCYTTHCFAGWAMILGGWEWSWDRHGEARLAKDGRTISSWHCDDEARVLLGLTDRQVCTIFYSFTDNMQKLAQQVGYVIGMDPFGPEADKILAASSEEKTHD